MLGDVHIAEPGALICFAGPRVIQQTIREQLPEGFQKAEYLLAHGMIDMVVHRHKLRETLGPVVPSADGDGKGPHAAKTAGHRQTRGSRLSQRQCRRRANDRDPRPRVRRHGARTGRRQRALRGTSQDRAARSRGQAAATSRLP